MKRGMRRGPLRGAYSLPVGKPICTKTTCLRNKIVLQGSHVDQRTNWHVHLLSLFVTCYKCFVACKVGSAATGKVKTFADTFLGIL